MSKPSAQYRERLSGMIVAGALYTADEVRGRLRLGTWAWRAMRRAGLPVIYRGRQAFVLGDDVLAFFRREHRPPGKEA